MIKDLENLGAAKSECYTSERSPWMECREGIGQWEGQRLERDGDDVIGE